MKIKLPFSQSAIEKFRARETEINSLGDVLAGLQKLAEQVEPEIEAARAAYYASPSVENALKWENAKRRLSPNIALSMLEGERSTVQAAQNAARSTPEYVALLARALGEHNEAIQECHDVKRTALLESLKTSGETNVNVDHMPSLRGLIERRDRNANTTVWMHQHPDRAARGMHIGNALAYLAESVDYVSPLPPPPRQMQGAVPGGGLPTNHGVLHPTNPEADAKLPTVPPEIAQAIRQQLVEQQNKLFAHQEAQALAELARQADLAKQAQAVGA